MTSLTDLGRVELARGDEFVESTTAAALEEKAKLQKHFGRFDMFFYLICTIVGIEALGTVAGYGWEGILLLVIMAITFVIPYGLLISELGSTFTEEGGPYIWTRMALGRFWGAINAVLYWISNPIWMGGILTLTAITGFSITFTNLEAESFGYYAFGLAFIWFATIAAILSFGVGKWIPTIGAISRLILMPFFAITVIKYGIDTGFNTPKLGDFFPDGGHAWWLLAYAAAPLLFFNLVGFELPNAAGDEMKDAQKDVPFAVLRSAGVALALFGIPTICILLVLPTAALSGASGFIDAIRASLTAWGGSVDYQTAADGSTNIVIHYTTFSQWLAYAMGAMFVWTIVSSGTTWIMGADRAIAIGCIDGCGPRFFGRFSSRFGTPVNVNILSGCMSTVFFVLATKLAGSSAFAVVLSMATLTTVISYALIFPALIKLRYSHPHVHRPYKVPGGLQGAWIVAGITTVWSVFCSIANMWPDAATVADYGVSRTEFELWVVGVLGTIFVLGCISYYLGAETRRDMVRVPLEGHETEAEATALASAD
jgi:amino acid transporter